MVQTSEMQPTPPDFYGRSNWRALFALLKDYALILGIIAASEQIGGGIVYIFAVWLIGMIQLGLGETLTHEASHFNLFKTRRFNQWSEFLCCYPFGFTLNDYRREHSQHHRLLNTNREQLHLDYGNHGLLDENRNMVWLWFFKPILGYAGVAYIRSLIQLATFKSAQKIVLFWVALLGISAWNGWLDLLCLYWIVPLVWSYASFFYWSEIEDHFNTTTGTRTNISWTNWLTHNNGYHAIHHRYPRIPWYRLKQAHFALGDNPTDISRGFFDTFRQISSRNSPQIPRPASISMPIPS